MPKRKYVSRKEVLQAIRYEPLKSGDWVRRNGEKEGKCQVCAVGAVLRKAGFKDEEIRRFGGILIDNFESITPYGAGGMEYVSEKLREHLDNEYYLVALSLKFESQALRTGTGKRTRKILANFVKVNFPKKIELSNTPKSV